MKRLKSNPATSRLREILKYAIPPRKFVMMSKLSSVIIKLASWQFSVFAATKWIKAQVHLEALKSKHEIYNTNPSNTLRNNDVETTFRRKNYAIIIT